MDGQWEMGTMDRKAAFLHVLLQLWPSHSIHDLIAALHDCWFVGLLRMVFAFLLSLIFSESQYYEQKVHGGPQIKVLPP